MQDDGMEVDRRMMTPYTRSVMNFKSWPKNTKTGVRGLCKGMEVRLRGLERDVERNGQSGHLVAFDEERKGGPRWEVKLCVGETVYVRPRHLHADQLALNAHTRTRQNHIENKTREHIQLDNVTKAIVPRAMIPKKHCSFPKKHCSFPKKHWLFSKLYDTEILDIVSFILLSWCKIETNDWIAARIAQYIVAQTNRMFGWQFSTLNLAAKNILYYDREGHGVGVSVVTRTREGCSYYLRDDMYECGIVLTWAGDLFS